MLEIFGEKQAFGIKFYSLSCNQHYCLVVIMILKQTDYVLTMTSIQW